MIFALLSYEGLFREMMASFMKDNDVQIRDGNDVNSIMRDKNYFTLSARIPKESEPVRLHSRDGASDSHGISPGLYIFGFLYISGKVAFPYFFALSKNVLFAMPHSSAACSIVNSLRFHR